MKSFFAALILFTMPVLCWGAMVPTNQQLKELQNLSINGLIDILKNDKASAGKTDAALEALALRKGQATPAIPAMMALLHKGNRYDCYTHECEGGDVTSSVMRTLQAMGPSAKPAVGELVVLLNLATGISPEPKRPDPLTPFYTCYNNQNCAKQICNTLRAISSGAVEAVPGLMAIIKDNAAHVGQNDLRAELFAVLEAIGPDAAKAVPLLISQANESGSGFIASSAIAALSQIAPDDPAAFSLLAKALTRPRTLNFYNSDQQELVGQIFAKKMNYSEADMHILASEIEAALKGDASDRYQLLSEHRMRPICDIFLRYQKYAAVTVPTLIRILQAYPANGAVDGSNIVIQTLGGFGEKAADAVPALTAKALDSRGSVYHKEAIEALHAIGTAEAKAAITDYEAKKWRSYR